jgi:LPXTG-motif cell wall-anchored protein
VDFLPSPTPVPLPSGAVATELTLPFAILVGLAVVATVILFAWRRRRST